MKKLALSVLLLLVSASFAFAHGGISKLPDTVQIMQYKMKLYMNADDADTKNNLAMAYFRTNQLDEAKNQLLPILEKDANNFNTLDGMGIILLKEGKADKALQYLQRAKEVNDKDLLLQVHLSVAHKQLNQADLAKNAMEKAKAMASSPEDLTKIQKEVKLITNS